MVFEPSDLTCPTLVLIGAQEYEKFEANREWAPRCVEEAQTSRKELIITPGGDADTYAIGTNLSLMGQLVFVVRVELGLQRLPGNEIELRKVAHPVTPSE